MELEQLLQPMMNGTDLSVKEALLKTLQADVQKYTDQWRVFTAELWARGISKEDFLAWVKEKEEPKGGCVNWEALKAMTEEDAAELYEGLLETFTGRKAR